MKKHKKISITKQFAIKQALRRMDEMGQKTLFVVDSKSRLLGTVTDGDIRRWILKSGNLNEAVSKVMNTDPVCLRNGYSKEEAKQLMVSNVIECIPVINEQNVIISAIRWFDIFDNKFKIHRSMRVPVIIMAGGEGSRLAPVTNILPKPLIPIGEKPIIELIIGKFSQYGCKDFYLTLNYKAGILKAYFDDHKHSYQIHYLQEKKPLGTAGSLHMVKDKIKTTLFVTNCDILIEADYADILKFHKNSKNDITLVVSMKHYKVPYGICEIDNGGNLKDIKEKPEFDFLANTGMYLMEKYVLKDIPENKFYNMTDLIEDYLVRGKRVGVYPVSEKSWLDMGQWAELQNMLQKLEIK